MNCYKATEKVKKMLMKLEDSTTNEKNNEFEDTVIPSTKTFGLWTFYTSKVSSQIQDKTTPIHQEVLLITLFLIFILKLNYLFLF